MLETSNKASRLAFSKVTILVIEKVVNDVIATNADKVDAYKNGKVQLFGFFVGTVMKALEGKANPGMVNELLKKKLG